VEVPEKPRVIAGRYELESLIGEGGMASVWRARDLTLERPVAVKLLYARDERDKENLVKQFVREARIAASVQHRNVIHIVDFGTTDERQPYMVMELLEGESLAARLQSSEPLGMAELVHVASLTLRGLEVVHDAGIVHRDLKPDNIYLIRDTGGGLFPKILDFGISRSVEPRSGRRSALTTKEGIIVGTPEYMSPEQARGVKSIDRRTDIYSMGVILYEALAGKIPFASENVGDLIIQIVTGTAPTAREVNPSVPQGLSNVVAKAMARRPEDRYQDAASMRDALHRALAAYDAGDDKRILSDLPPPPSRDIGIKNSQERLRTLEFPLGDDESAELDLADERAATADADGLDDLAAQLRGRPSRARWVGGLAFVSAVALALIVLFQPDPAAQGSIHAARGAASAETETTPTTGSQPPPEPAPPALPKTITVTLADVPEGAQVMVDGKQVEGSELELPRDGRNRVIKVLAEGKTPWQVVHHASADATYGVLLVDEARPSRPPRPEQQAKRARPRPRPRPKKPPAVLRKLDF
jgi:serine/threonine-protein kinase